jgi:hypothetical protein
LKLKRFFFFNRDIHKLEEISITINVFLERLIFVNKNWLNDPRIDCKPPSNVVELIEKDLDFEEELENLKVLLSSINFWTYKM